MCTVTGYRDGNKMLLTMNRDELVSREPETVPVIVEEAGIRRLEPHDSRTGGTWVSVNDRGVAAALLNLYRPSDKRLAQQPSSSPSRGTIIQRALSNGSTEKVSEWITEKFDPSPYPSFTLLLTSVNNALRFDWDGEGHLSREPLPEKWWLVSSSSWRTEDVLAWRDARFGDWLTSGCTFNGRIPAIHLLRESGLDRWSPLMRRSRAATRSITQIEVIDGGQAAMCYWPDPLTTIDPTECADQVTMPLRN
jgi:uncharacterized protein with NRDE domain